MRNEDEALAHLMDDINNHGRNKRTGVGIPFLLFGAMFCLAVFILITATGCNTVAGMAADVEAAARGTQEYLADGVEQRSPRPASHTAAH